MLTMHKISKVVHDIIIAGADEQYDISIRYTLYDGDTSTTDHYIIDGLRFLKALQRQYSQWSYVIDTDNHLPPAEEFDLIYQDFKNYYLNPVFSRVISAILSKYNPLENYDGFEVESMTAHSRGHQSGVITGESGAGASTMQHYETTYDDGTTDNHLKYSDNSSQTEPSSSSTDYGVMTQGADGNIILDNAHVQNATDGSNSRNLHKHGNMGSKTTQSIIREELELRSTNIIQDIVKQFAKQYLVMVGGDDD